MNDRTTRTFTTHHPSPPTSKTAYPWDGLSVVHTQVTIADPGCVAKTYPHFFRDLEAVRCGKGC